MPEITSFEQKFGLPVRVLFVSWDGAPIRVKSGRPLRFFKRSHANSFFGLHIFKSQAMIIVSLSLWFSCLQAQTPSELLLQADHLADIGDWHLAGPLYTNAEAGFRRTGNASSELYAKFGRLHRTIEEGSYRVARAEVKIGLASPTAENNPLLRIRGLSLLGNIDLNLNTAAAREDWNEVLAIALKIGDTKWENRAKGELGLVAGVSGDIGAAGLALYAAITKAQQLGDAAACITFSTWLANGMAVNGMADRALKVIDGAIAFATKSGYVEVPLQLSIAKVRALMNTPEQQRAQSLAEANELVTIALAQAQRQGVLGAQTELLIEAGRIASTRGDLVSAERAFRQAVEVSQSAALPRQEGETCLRLSQFYRSMNKPLKASTSINQGIRALQRVEKGYDLPLFVAEKAEVEIEMGSLRAADASFERATDLVEGLLVNAPSSQVKSGMIAALSTIYLGHFRLVWNRLQNADRAFAIIENVRGRALLDSIRYARQSGSLSTSLTHGEAEIVRLQRSLMHDRLSNVQTKRVLDLLDVAYVQTNPVDYLRERQEMKLIRRRPVRVAALQSQLRLREKLVEYVLDDKGSYAIEISRDDFRIHPLAPRGAISKLARSFVTAVRNGDDPKVSSQELYRELLWPVLGQGVSSLIVVPDGPLHLIPFSALMNPKGTYTTGELTLSAAPSASIYYALRKQERTASAVKPFLGVASSPVAKSDVTTISTRRGTSDLRAANLAPLRFGREEIMEAAAIFGPLSVTLDGAHASEAALKSLPLGDFRVIHLAAHGVGDQLEPDRAALVLAPGSDLEDGLWQAREIRRTRLKADVVVLSACETGSGKLQGQEGVMNLARAFLTAGARSVVASLWAVDDRSTATLMESMYRHLKTGVTVSEALSQAQRDFIADYGEKAKPNLWAGFEVIGDGTRRFTFTNKTVIETARRGVR